MISGISADGICEKLKSTFDKCGDFNLRPVLCAGKAVYLANIGNFSGRTYITESVVKPLIAADAPPDDDTAFEGILCSSEAEVLYGHSGGCERLCGVGTQ